MDRQLRGLDFLDVERFPRPLFVSTNVTPGGKQSAKIAGDLPLPGVTRPITLDAQFTEQKHTPGSLDEVVRFLASALGFRHEMARFQEMGGPALSSETSYRD